MRPRLLAAGALASAGAACTIAAFAAQGSDPPPTTRAAAGTDPGLGVWLEQGCGSCHAFKPAGSTGPIGPDLQKSLRGKSHDYVMESIVLPHKKFAAGFSTDIMPDDYARRIAPEDLEPLVRFLMDGARR
jgi:mono/diheme cytochrome c family protein